MTTMTPNETSPDQAVEAVAVTQAEQRRNLSHHEQMVDAEAQCIPCRLCGGKAVITDAGLGAGYYIACHNASTFNASQGCLITERRLGGWAYNVMEWWNRLHRLSAIPTPPPADHTDLIGELEARDADWQENCDRWTKAASDLGQPMDAEIEAKCRLTLYRRAADALQAHASPRELDEDAANWRAFISSARFKMMGAASFLWEDNHPVGVDPDRNNWVHFGLEVWDQHPAGDDAQAQVGRELLLTYVKHMRARTALELG